MPSIPHSPLLLLLLPLLSLFLPASAQGTISLALATSNDETATTLSLPFNTLFSPSSPRNKGVEIHVSSGAGVAIAQDAITCQCFSDAAGTQRLGESFTNVFPGARLAAEQPVEIGSIFCSDEEGLKKQIAGSGAAEKVPLIPSAVTTSKPSASTTRILQSSTAATSATATATAVPNNKTPTAFIRFNLSPDPSDDSSTQMPVPIDSSIIQTDNQRAASVEVTTIDGLVQSADSGLVCQAFTDTEAEEPLGMGFGFEEVVGLGGEEGDAVRSVGSVGCAVLGWGHLGGRVGLVRS